MTQLALFETETPAPARAHRHARVCCDGSCLTHALLPNMAYACYETILTVGGHFEMGTVNFENVTCPGCREQGIANIQIRMRRQMGRCTRCRGTLKRQTCTDCGTHDPEALS